MDRSNMHEFYSFINNGNGTYYSSYYDATGQIVVQTTTYPNMKPLKFNPANLKQVQVSFGTNKSYFSGVRSVMLNWKLIEDGADIVRHIKYNGTGYADSLYLLILRYNPDTGIFEKYYEGRFDLAQCSDKKDYYDVPCLDASVWGVLSQNDDVKYGIDCTPQNPKSVPVLFDGVNLKSRYTWQPINAPFKLHNDEGILFDHPIDLVLVNSDGDSSNIIVKNQTYIPEGGVTSRYSKDNYIYRPQRKNTVRLFGNYIYQAKTERPGEVEVTLDVRAGTEDEGVKVNLGTNAFHINETYSYHTMTFDVTFDIPAGGIIQIFMYGSKSTQAAGLHDWVILPDIYNIFIETETKSDSTIIYCLRPLDVLQEIVGRATNNKFTANSNFFSANQNIVLTCGDALRSSPNAQLKTSFKDWFRSYDIEYYLAFRIVGNQLWVEPATTVYDDSTNLFDIGEISDYEVTDAYDYLCNEIELNMNKQDYRHTSGRLEFNGLNTFSIFQYNVKNKISLISAYRKDCYGMQFIIMDYQQQSTEDNSGDDTVFMVDITNEQGSSGVDVFNFQNVTVNSAPLSPIIHFPRNNDVIYNQHPVIKGQCQPNTQFSVFVDSILDGTSTSDASGNFSYNIITPLSEFVQDTQTGVHTIDLSFTDLTGTFSTRIITVLSGVISTNFENVKNGDTLYNNKPLVRGFLETATTLPLYIDGIKVDDVTGDGNGRWSYQMPVLKNGRHLLTIGTISITINIFSFVDVPIITSFSEGFQLINNLPLVEGVAKPGTKVDLYLDYYADKSIGTTFADSNGNWSIQLEPIQKDDGSVLTPIPNGEHILSTSLDILSTKVDLIGYLLNRPPYSSIEGVIDNTVFNTLLSPKHNLLNRMVYWKSIFAQQPNTVIKFETGDKNPGFATTLNGVTVRENEDVYISRYDAKPLFYPYIFSFVAETPFFFAAIMENFSNGGLVRTTFMGTEIHCLPIGDMKVEDVTRNVQKWSLLVSAKTPLINLLKLSTPGLILNSMSNTIFRSDYNTLHMVKYNYNASVRYDEQPELYEDWFANRNNRWVNNPPYVQKWQKSDPLVDQIIVNSVTGSMSLAMYDCATGLSVADFPYSAVSPSPIPSPDIVLQTTLNLSSLPDGDYFFTMNIGGIPVAISEKISLADRWYGTILVDAGNSRNKVGSIFSNGFRSQIRVEGLVEKYVMNLDAVENEDEIGDHDVLSSVATRKRTVLFGSGTGIPDYLYVKIAQAIVLDDLKIQGVAYTIDKAASVEPANKIEGYPMYYYNVDFFLKNNINGYLFDGVDTDIINNVVLVTDAGAFGVGGSQLINIELENE